MSVSFAIDNETQTALIDDNNILKEDTSSNATSPDDGKTFEDIKTAIDDADDGGTVNLAGDFKGTGERIEVSKNVTVDGDQKTVLDGNNACDGFIFNDASDVVFKGMTFKNFNNPNFGNGIFQQEWGNPLVTCSFIDCSFLNNTGNIMHVYNASFSFKNCNFSDNVRMSAGGVFENCNFVNNSGNINSESCTDCSFIGNSAFNANCKTILDSIFDNNVRSYVNGGDFIKNCSFTNNQNIASGIVQGYSTIVNCYFENNSAEKDKYENGFGGAVGDAKSVINSTFIANSAFNMGGAIYNVVEVENCTFIKNSAFYGGAIEFVSGDNLPQTVKNCIFINNTGLNYGGAIDAFGELSLLNCSFIANSAKATRIHMGGGAAIAIRGKLDVDDCSFENNFAESSGSAIYVDAIMEEQYVTLSNSNFTKNVAQGNFEITGYPFKNYGNGLIYIVGGKSCSISFVKCNEIVKNTDKFKTKLAPAVKSASVAYRNYITINLKDSVGNPCKNLKVTVKINGNSFAKTSDKNGQIKLKASLAPKAYTMTVSYAGSNFISKLSKSFKITVKKATPKLTASAKKFKASLKTKKYTIALKCSDKTPVKKVKVTLKIRGKTFTAKTNSYGKATFKITKVTKKGTSKAVVRFGGSKYFNKVSKTVKITLK